MLKQSIDIPGLWFFVELVSVSEQRTTLQTWHGATLLLNYRDLSVVTATSCQGTDPPVDTEDGSTMVLTNMRCLPWACCADSPCDSHASL